MSAYNCDDDPVVRQIVASGESGMLEALYKNYYRVLLRAAERILHDREESHDVVIDLLLHVQQRHQFLGLKCLQLPYLVRAATNRALKVFTKKQRGATFEPLSTDQYPALADMPSEDILFAELKQKMKAALQRIPRKTRGIFLLRRIHHMSDHEISMREGLSVKSVQRHFYQAQSYLRNAWKEE